MHDSFERLLDEHTVKSMPDKVTNRRDAVARSEQSLRPKVRTLKERGVLVSIKAYPHAIDYLVPRRLDEINSRFIDWSLLSSDVRTRTHPTFLVTVLELVSGGGDVVAALLTRHFLCSALLYL